MAPSIQSLTIFVRTVEQSSFVGAARSLLIDPAAVSRAIRSLEHELDVVLFARSTRAVKLTAEGARFYRDCLAILQKLTEATQRFRADRATPTGLLKVGMAPGVRRRVLMRALPSFQRQYPEIEIVLISVDDRTDAVGKNIDLLVRARSVRWHGSPRPEPQGLVVRKLFTSPYVVCASKAYLDRAGTPRHPADLARHDCVSHLNLDYDAAHQWHFSNADGRHTITLVPKLRVQGVDAVCEAGLAGCGIVRMLTANIEDELRERRLVPILTDWECLGVPPMLAVYRKTRPVIPQVAAFIRHLAEALRRYDRDGKPAV